MTARRSVSTVSIVLLFVHPEIDPAEITAKLGVTPFGTQRAGERMVLPDGTVRRSRYFDSRWSLVQRYYDDFSSCDDGRLASRLINERLSAVLEPLLREREFVRRLASEGEVSLGLTFPGQFHIGLVIEPDILGSLADLGIGFSIEIFPNSAS